MVKYNFVARPNNDYDVKAWTEWYVANPDARRSVGAAGDDNGESGDNGGDDSAEAARLKAAADAAAKAGDIEAAKKAADAAKAEADKIVASKKKRVDELTDQVKSLNDKLKDFEGLDPAEIRSLLSAKKEAEEKELAARGEWERLKTRMADEHKSQMDKIASELNALKDQLGQRDGLINRLTIGHSFDSSKFIQDQLVLTSSKVRTLYGEYFDVQDGVVIGYDKPRGSADRTPFVDSMGRPVSFDDALQKIVDSDPDKETILKSKVKPGAGSETRTDLKVQTKKEELRGLDKITQALTRKKV